MPGFSIAIRNILSQIVPTSEKRIRGFDLCRPTNRAMETGVRIHLSVALSCIGPYITIKFAVPVHRKR